MEKFCLPEQDIDAALTLIQLAAGEISCNDRTDHYDPTAPRGKSKRKRPSKLDPLYAIETILPFGRREFLKSIKSGGKSDGCDDDAKTNEEGERSSDLIRYITDDDDEFCSSVETRGEEREIDFWCVGDYLCTRKMKLRSVVDIYKTTKPLLWSVPV